jgi:hypothetical protein
MGIVGDLPHMAIGVGEITRVSAPENLIGIAREICPLREIFMTT